MTTMKTAIVTGASSGIGLGLTTALLEHGYRVVANSRQITQAGTLTASADLALVNGDIAHPDTARTVVEIAVRRFGSVDLLVNNAGIFISKPFTDYTTAELFGSSLLRSASLKASRRSALKLAKYTPLGPTPVASGDQ